MRSILRAWRRLTTNGGRFHPGDPDHRRAYLLSVILLQSMAPTYASKVARRILSALDESVHDQAGAIAGSIGVATYRQGDSRNSVVARADSALYSAKASGRAGMAIAE